MVLTPVVGLLALAMVVVPILLPRDTVWALVLVPVAIANPTLWALIHEAIHGVLADNRRSNLVAARLLSIAHGAPFALLRAGHLLHHRYNRTELDAAEAYDPALVRPWSARVAYYWRLCGGLYVAEVLAAPALLLPARRLRALAAQLGRSQPIVPHLIETILRTRTLGAARVDALAVFGVHGAVLWAYGDHAWMYVALLASRALSVSVLDNVYHYGTPLTARAFALNLHAPRLVQAMMLNFTLHGVHHRHPELPWHRLPEHFAGDGDRHHATLGALLARQFRGPIDIARLREPAGN
ncbi:MAG: fatty acid desaturase [Proteobacteria bacterium]|nr:fatty acid desaturase [Burkholderiales bacterium]